MKVRAVIVLIAVMMAILSSGPFNIDRTAAGFFLVTLNVCDAGAHYLSASSESACTYEAIVTLHIFETTSSAIISQSSVKPFLIAFQKDRPPKV